MKIIKILAFAVALPLAFTSCISTDDNGGGVDDTGGLTILANLFISNNVDGNITVYDFTTGAGVFSRTLPTQSSDAEGIFYDSELDQVIQVSRSQDVLNAYNGVSLINNGNSINPAFSSSNVLDSPRDIAVNGDFMVVSDTGDFDNNPMTEGGRFFIFSKTDTSFTLRNTVTVDFAVWGIEFIGDDLFVVVDKTGDIASFDNFIGNNTTDATVAPSKRITIAGITRTHGIVYDGVTLVLTDIGDAASETDGGFHVINNFPGKYTAVTTGGTLAMSEQVRLSGSFTRLGNPVAAAYDDATGTVFIAERANNGGRILFYNDIGAGGNLAPSFAGDLPGASSLHFVNAN